MKKIKLYSYYFPNWHQDDRNDNWHGKGWTEWEVLKCARARFVGHKQPLIPTWGYEDESKPEVMEKKIETAKKYGIDGFIFDTYYYAIDLVVCSVLGRYSLYQQYSFFRYMRKSFFE